jgi:hypothetical protein
MSPLATALQTPADCLENDFRENRGPDSGPGLVAGGHEQLWNPTLVQNAAHGEIAGRPKRAEYQMYIIPLHRSARGSSATDGSELSS